MTDAPRGSSPQPSGSPPLRRSLARGPAAPTRRSAIRRVDRSMPLHRVAGVLATIGGIGRVRWAPGTWGSLIGLALGLFAISAIGRLGAFLLMAILVPPCALICTAAERAAARHDPPSVILDEVIGMAFVPILLPWAGSSLHAVVISFLMFRLHDIAKPPPLKRLARLPAGWGIVADDLGAAAYTVLSLSVLQRLLSGPAAQ